MARQKDEVLCQEKGSLSAFKQLSYWDRCWLPDWLKFRVLHPSWFLRLKFIWLCSGDAGAHAHTLQLANRKHYLMLISQPVETRAKATQISEYLLSVSQMTKSTLKTISVHEINKLKWFAKYLWMRGNVTVPSQVLGGKSFRLLSPLVTL